MGHAFRIVNVFTVDGDRLSGNPLCVFEDARGLAEPQMQALARQMNLSETTFVLPPTVAGADARVRIFTPGFEMPFAGHPTLGSAAVIAAGRRAVTLELAAGLVPVTDDGAGWTLRTARAPLTREVGATRAELASMVGLPTDAIGDRPLWVDIGVEQLVIPIVSPELVRRARPDAVLLERFGMCASRGEAMAYLWARPERGGQNEACELSPVPNDQPSALVPYRSDRHSCAGPIDQQHRVGLGQPCEPAWTVRFLFTLDGSVVEDPATGSACANLGGWMIATGQPLPMAATLRQGDAVKRPSRLGLRVDADGAIFVTGAVIELGRGTIDL